MPSSSSSSGPLSCPRCAVSYPLSERLLVVARGCPSGEIVLGVRPQDVVVSQDERSDQNDAENEAEENPLKPKFVFPDVQNFQEKIHQAPNHRHDEDRANGDGDVIA